jgi:predicted ABC-type ATPase
MSRLVIIRGNSGSGKSTVAKRLHYELGSETMLVPQDVIRREILKVKDGPHNPSLQLIYDTAMYGKRIGYDVILEGILNARNYGGMLSRLTANFDVTYSYYFDITFEETLRRHRLKPNAHEFGETEMRKWWAEHDVLGFENEKSIGDDLSEEQIVELILSDLRQ